MNSPSTFPPDFVPEPYVLDYVYPYEVKYFMDDPLDFNAGKLYNYPSIYFIPEPAVQTYDFPERAYYFMNDPFDNNPPKLSGYPSIDFISDPIIQTYDFPETVRYFMNDPVDCTETKLTGFPSNDIVGEYILSFGPASYSLIETVEIPKSVVFIADYAFWDSKITHVKINRHCEYYEHSFPPGCHIKLYRDDE